MFDRNESFYTAIQKNVLVRLKEFWVVTVRNSQEKIVLLPEVSFDAANDQRTVRVADLLGDYADHISAFYTQIAGIETGRYFNSRAAARIRSCVCWGMDRDAADLFRTAEQVPLVSPTRSATICKVTGGGFLRAPFFCSFIQLSLLTVPEKWRLETAVGWFSVSGRFYPIYCLAAIPSQSPEDEQKTGILLPGS